MVVSPVSLYNCAFNFIKIRAISREGTFTCESLSSYITNTKRVMLHGSWYVTDGM